MRTVATPQPASGNTVLPAELPKRGQSWVTNDKEQEAFDRKVKEGHPPELIETLQDSFRVPARATIEYEYVKCNKPGCERRHGPYAYAYWKGKGQLRKRYLGKDMSLVTLKHVSQVTGLHYTPREFKKVRLIFKAKSLGVKLAEVYGDKLDKNKVSLQYAYEQTRAGVATAIVGEMARKKLDVDTLAKILPDDLDGPVETLEFLRKYRAHSTGEASLQRRHKD